MISHEILLMRPTAGSANWLKAWGERLRSPMAHDSHRSISRTWMVLSWSMIDGEN